jgi:hypothetical protein
MKAGIAAIILGYVLSQFYRAFLAVLAPVLGPELGATPQDLAAASGWWFLAFAVMQIPVGEALDRVGPRATTACLMVVGAGGAAIFASATAPGTISIAMALIGVGCSPVLMAAYFIFARSFSPAVFGTLAGMVIGIGSLGNIGASLPLTWAVEAFGWRATIWGLAAMTLAVALVIALVLRDPPKVAGGAKGSVLDLLAMPGLWPILIMMAACYGPQAGLRGLWVGPYLSDVHGAGAGVIGAVTLAMGLAMVVGNFAYGPLDRLLGTRKWLIFGGNFGVLLAFGGLILWPTASLIWIVAMVIAIGLMGSSFPMVMAHGRAFLPPHLVGRGVTLLNLFGIAAAGLMQFVTGRIHAGLTPSIDILTSAPPATPYLGIFAFYAGIIVLGLTIYLFARDRTD